MPNRAVATTAALELVQIVEEVSVGDVISRGPSKIEVVNSEYARFYPQWESQDLQKLPVSVLVPISVIPRIIEQLLEVLGHRPIWPEKH